MTLKSKARKKSTRLLSSSRPKLSSKNQNPPPLPSKVTRTLIRSHHNLHKQLKKAENAKDPALVALIRAQIDAQGGLARYQEASIQGQSIQRGGDSSKVLVEWLQESYPELGSARRHELRLLEVGALRIDNACSKCSIFDVQRIDLNSQHKEILQQDFMERPLPVDDEDRCRNGFDVISLSLVVNYVPDPVGRGNMLKRVASFLRRSGNDKTSSFAPGLFLVLPSPCVTNSRYLDEQRMEDIITNLGYVVLRKKLSSKLVYYYLKLNHCEIIPKSFSKKELRGGGTRNNFAIVL